MRFHDRTARCFAVVFLATTLVANANDYPARPIKVIIPFAPGSSIEFVARIVAERFQTITSQTWIIDNRGGAGGTVAAAALEASPADGYTLMAVSVSQMSLNPRLYKKLPYSPERFEPISGLSHTDNVFVVHPSVPASTLAEFITYARSNPGAIKIGSTGVGTPSHFLGSAFNKSAGIDMLNVPYRGVGPALNDLVGGHVHAAFSPSGTVKELIATNKIRGLASSSAQRLRLFPDLPTFRELGHTDVVAPLWSGLVAPAGTPKEILRKLNALVVDIMRSPDITNKFRDADHEPILLSSEDFAEFMKVDRARWEKVIAESGFEPSQ